MNNFIKKMLTLGAELDKETNLIGISMIINDAEILYSEEIKSFTKNFNNKKYDLLVDAISEMTRRDFELRTAGEYVEEYLEKNN